MLPVRKVILYKHGVGYFERQGEVDGDAVIELAFRQAEMNDVLKSLTVLDLSGGVIRNISYESTRPVEQQLRDIAIDLDDEQALSGLLTQIKGAGVAVVTGDRATEGIVTGIECVEHKEDRASTTLRFLTLLVGGETLQSFDLRQVTQIRLLDEPLRRDLQHLLEVLISTKKKDQKRLTVYARGEGRRALLAGYTVETPVWKTSYRILLDEEKPLIQGWALVDNTQDEDWDDIALTLIAGLPISFVHDLYSPRYKKRPLVKVEEEAAYAPPLLEAGHALDEEPVDLEDFGDLLDAPFGAEAEPADSAPAPAPAGQRFVARNKAAQRMSAAQARRQPPPAQTRTSEIGDSFQYQIGTPVTVKRHQSALVPIVQTAFEGKRVAVYNPDVREKNPLSAVLFKNTTGLMLAGGPLTVFEQETYLGEAMLDILKPDEERLLPFSVELGCVIGQDHHSDERAVHRVTAADGILSLHSYQLQRTIYMIDNKNDRALDLFLDHRFKAGFTLENTPEPAEQTEHFYRFRLEAAARKTTRFTVTEKGAHAQTFAITGIERKTLGLWFESRYIDETARQSLDEFIALNEQISELEQRIARAEQDIKAVFKNQERLRQNLKALGNSSDEVSLRERYVKELAQEEDKLVEHRTQINQRKDRKQELEQQLANKIKAFSYANDCS